jgi:YbbR domain-containing protein
MVKRYRSTNSMKIFAVFIAVSLWMYVLNSVRVKQEKVLEIETQVPDSLMITQRPLNDVLVSIEGPRAIMRSLQDKPLKYVLDVGKLYAKSGSRATLQIKPVDLNLPRGVRVERIENATLRYRFEKKAKKYLPVAYPGIWDVPKEMKLEILGINPKLVEVSGPKILVDTLKEIQVRPVNFDQLVGQNQIPLEWQTLDERLIIGTDLMPTLSYRLTSDTPNLVLESVKIQSSYKIVGASRATLVLWGDEELVKKVDRRSFPAQILASPNLEQKKRLDAFKTQKNSKNIKAPKESLKLQAKVPPGFHVLEIKPSEVFVTP